ncbi:MAG: HTTM domain-containing protein [Gaiellaceae bacterium]
MLRRVDGWIFAPGDARRLAAVRIGLCSVLALRLATTDYGAVAGQPAALFQPVFYMKLFEQMPSPEVATVLQVCGVAAAVAAAAGLALRATLPLAVACSLVLNGMLNSAGRVIVGDALLTLCLLVLVASGSAAGRAWSLSGRRPAARDARFGWPVRTMMIAIALAYFFAGLQKWRFSGPAWVTSGNLRWILYAANQGRLHPSGIALLVADRPLLAHALAAGSLLLETCFPLVLFVPRLRWLFIPAAVAMHVTIRLATGLDYSAQWLTLVIVFVNWPVVVAWLRQVAARLPASREAPG